MKITLYAILLTGLLFGGTSNQIFAQDRRFAWTYESTTLPKGGIDIEPWITYSSGRSNYYSAYKSRLEFETGLTDRIQTAFYLNSDYKAFATEDTSGNVNEIETESEFSFSNEWKFNLLNPSIDPVGLALYAEYTLSPKETELELKLILDKRFGNNILAFNEVFEAEFEKEFEEGEGISTEIEYVLESDLAYMYMLKPFCGLGAEVRFHNVLLKGDLEHSALLGGPSFFYSNNNFYGTISAMPYLTSFKGKGLEEYEKFSLRIVLGISF